MSKTVDSRVVEMRFDNKDFEQNVSQSMSTLDKLKQALKFEDSGKAFDNLSKAAANVDVGSIGSAVDTVKEKFSALEIAGITALVNLTNKAVDAGAEIVKSLTIDQVTEGWDKYQTKTSAVATIMAATRHEFADEAEQMEYVNAQLEKLNWFTDETSFNLVDMVDNIGKFTSAGVALDDAVTAMQGIAEWGYMSGSNIQQISHAMYNLSQAMGTGKMQVVDWKSIENANMATMEFKQLAIEAGLAMGTLKREVDGTITTVDQGLAKKFEGYTVTAQNFRDTLSDAWLTSDVMIRAFSEYGNFTELLYESLNATGLETSPMLKMLDDYTQGLLDLQEVATETGLTTEELKTIFDTLSDPTYELGRAAFKASQECRTFADVINYTKDAVSTGWMNTFEILFGDYMEVKELWSQLAEVFYEIFVKSGEARNEMLGAWAELGGRESLINSIVNSYNAVVKVLETVREAFAAVFPAKDIEDQARGLFTITRNIEKFTEKLILTDEAADNLKKRITPMLDTIKRFGDGLKQIGRTLQKTVITSIQKLAKPLASLVDAGKQIMKHVFGPLMKVPKTLWKDFLEGFGVINEGALEAVDGFSKWLQKIADMIKHSEIFHTKYVAWFADISRILADCITGFLGLTQTIDSFEKGGEGFGGVLQVIIDKLLIISDTVVSLIEHLTGWDLSGLRGNIEGFLSDAQTALNDFAAAIEAVINPDEGILTNFGRAIEAGFKFIEGKITEATGFDFSGINKVLDQIPGIFDTVSEYVSDVLNGKTNPIEDIAMAVGYGGYLLEQKISEFTGIDFTGFNKALMRVPDMLSALKDYAGKVIKGQANPFEDLAKIIGDGAKRIQAVITELTGIDFTGFNKFIADIPANIKAFAQMVKNYFSGGNNPLKDFGDSVSDGASAVTKGVKAWAGLDIGPFDEKTQEMVEKIDKFVSHFDGFFKLIKGVWDLIGSLVELIEPVAQVIGEVFSAIAKNISKAAQELQNVKGQDVLDGFMGMIGKIIEFFKGIDFGGIFAMIRDIGLTVMATEIAEFCITIINAIRRVEGQESALEGLETLAKAILMIIGAMLLINTMSESELETGRKLIAALIATLASVEVLLMLLQRVAGNAVNTAALAGFFTSLGIALIACVVAIKMLSGEMTDPDGWWHTLVALADLLGILAGVVTAMVFMTKYVDAKKLAGVAAILLAFGSAAKKLAKAIKIIVDIGDIKAASIAAVDLGGLLVAMGGAIVALGKFGGGGANMLAASASILIVAGALNALVPVIKSLVEIGMNNMKVVLIELAALMVELAVPLYALANPAVLAGAGSIAILAASLLLLLPVIVTLAAMDWKTVAIAMAELLVFLLGLAGVGAVATAGVVGLAAIAAVLTSIGIAAAAIGAGMLMAAEAFAIFVDALEKGYPLFKEIFGDIMELVKKVVNWFKEKFGEAWEWIKEKVKGAWDWVKQKVKEVWDWIVQKVKDAWDWLKQNFKNIIDGIVKGLKDFWEGVKKKFSDAWKWIKEKFGEIKKVVGEKVEGFWKSITGFFKDLWESISGFFGDLVKGVGEKVGEFLEKGKEIITNIKKGAEEKFESAIEAVVGFFSDLKKKITEKITDFINIGKDIVDGIKKGISDAWGGFTSWTSEKFDGLVQGWNDFWGIKSPSKLTAEMGKYIVDGFVKGFGDNTQKVANAAEDMMKATMSAFDKQAMKLSPVKAINYVAKDAYDTLKKTAAKMSAVKTATNLVTEAASVIKKTTDKDMAGPIERTTVKLRSLMRDIWGKPVMPTLAEDAFISDVGNAVNSINQMEVTPTVTPVVNMDDVDSQMSTSLDGTYEVKLVDIAQINASGFDGIQNELRLLNSDIDRYITGLRDDIVSMKEDIKNLKVVMDTGTLVGEITAEMDRSLGRRAILAERGV